jgi:pectate lyase/uncharacterized protein YjdB
LGLYAYGAKTVKTRKSLWSAGIFFSALFILTFTCKSPADDTQPGGKAPVLVEEITINSGDLTLKTGDTVPLTVSVSPPNAANKNVIWNSNSGAVTVNQNAGEITAKAVGSAIIKAAAADGSGIWSQGITITVINKDPVPPVPVEEIIINGGDDLSLIPEQTKKLSVNVLPANASNKDVTWESNDPQKVEVLSQTGEIKALREGTAVITASAQDDSEVQGSVTVTVTAAGTPPVLVTGVAVNGGNFSLEEGEARTLSASVLPLNATDKTLLWSSGAPAVAEVNPETGKVTAIAQGMAVITATAQDGSGAQGSVTVTVTPPQTPSVHMTPQEIFAALKGQKITTNGWTDIANGGAGLSYANPAALTLIDDAGYPNAVDKRTAFTTAINSDNDKFIIVSGDIDLGDGVISDADKSYFDAFDPVTHKRVHGDIRFNIRSNTTIIGINDARLMFGGLNISGRTNVIIRNITFYDAHGSTEEDTAFNVDSKASIDALTVQGTSDGVWVDHCKFTDGTCNDMIRNYNHDGAFDIPKGKNITVSWCEFTNHDKVMLVAGSDSDANAVAADRQITLHHNYFHGTTQRMPRTRGTQMHVYNNYYNNIGTSGNTGSFMGPGWGAEFIVENNYFSSKSGKTIEWFDTSPEYPVKFYYTGNNRADGDTAWWGRASNPKPWLPAYQYTPDNNAGLPTSIPAGAGPSLTFEK